jgi:peroxiredoxin
MNRIQEPKHEPRWPRTVLRIAAIYNLVWGAWVIFFPNHLFDWTQIDRPNYPGIWQCVGMIVGVYGIGYWFAADDFRRHWPIVLVGFLGKIFGPIGFVQSAMTGVLPWSWGLTIITNDLIWWIPFAAMLYITFKDWSDPRRKDPNSVTEGEPKSIAQMNKETLASDGQTLSEISHDQKTLLVFLRHSGCTFCRQALDELKKMSPKLVTENVVPVVVHMGSIDDGQSMLAAHHLQDTLQVSDPSCQLYRSYQLERGRLSQLFGFEVWWAGFKAAILQRHGLGRLGGDGFQLGGAFLIRDDKILDAHRSSNAADATPFCKLNLSS